METNHFAKKIESLAILADPIRRRLYVYVAGQDQEVGRDDVARALRISRAVAAFHLDKLVKARLLVASFRRLSRQAGPGAGRPSKLYRRSPISLDVSLPQRRYELAAQVLTQALANTRSEATLEALRAAAREWGRRLAQQSFATTSRGLPLNRASRALQDVGFEPRRKPGGELVLHNCPFDALRSGCTEIVCGMNLALIEGLLQGLELQEVEARLAPSPGLCCVALRSRPGGERSDQSEVR